jgi:UDP-glucose 4-epimerase
VLGAAGFIGRHLALHFANAGNTVIAATRHPAEFDHPRIQSVVERWDEAAQFARWLPGCRAAVHAASSSTPGSSDARPQLDGNLRTTLAMIEALQEAPSCRVLFFSSGGTLYGDRATPAIETDPLRPRSYHGAGKAAAEHFLHAWATQYEGTVTMLRPSNVFGPGQSARKGFGIIPAAFECALHGQPLRIWGDGSSVRDYLYIDDLLALCAGVLDAKPAPGAYVYNAASGEAIRLDALLDRIEAVTGRTFQRILEPARRVDVHSIVSDARAARDSFNWTPGVPLTTGLERTWQWYCTRR